MKTRRSLALALALASATAAGAGKEEPIEVPSAMASAKAQTEAWARAHYNAGARAQALEIRLDARPESEGAPQARTRTRKPYAIGVHREAPGWAQGNLAPRLRWTEEWGGAAFAALRVHAPGAHSVRIALEAALPEGASVQIFDAEGRAQGRAHEEADFEAEGGTRWLASVPGERLDAQVTVRAMADRKKVAIALARIAHRTAPQQAQASERCRRSAAHACPRTAAEQAARASSVRIEFEDGARSVACSATLVNTKPRAPHAPAVLASAAHCVRDAASAASVEAVWFAAERACEGTHTETVRSFGGAQVLVASPAQDTALLALDAAPPAGARYAGWSTAPAGAGTMVSTTHHPKGRGAHHASGVVRAVGDFDVEGTALEGALETTWAEGVTERGSSGAGLFTADADARLIGVLSGGEGPCNAEGDVFGAFAAFAPGALEWLAPTARSPKRERAPTRGSAPEGG